MNKKIISIVSPVYNEEENLLKLYEELIRVANQLTKYEYEIILVDDGSKDKSFQIMKELCSKDKNVRAITFTRNFGHEASTTAGLNYCNGDAVIIIDADLQDPPELIPEMLKLWEQGYEIVYAKRKSREGETFLKKFTSKLFYRVFNGFADTKIPEDTGDFRLIDRRVVSDFNNFKEKNRIVRGLISWGGYKQTCIEFNRKKRNAGETKYNYIKLMRLAIDSITSFSTAPLTLIAVIGMFISGFSIALGSVFILFKLFTNIPINGWTSLIVTILFLNGFQIFLIGVVGQYIARISCEVKERPLYLVKEILNNKTDRG